MYGSINILLHQSLGKQNGILVVITFPGHETDQRVLTKCQLTLRSGRTVSDHLSLFYMVTLKYNGLLIITVRLVGS